MLSHDSLFNCQRPFRPPLGGRTEASQFRLGCQSKLSIFFRLEPAGFSTRREVCFLVNLVPSVKPFMLLFFSTRGTPRVDPRNALLGKEPRPRGIPLRRLPPHAADGLSMPFASSRQLPGSIFFSPRPAGRSLRPGSEGPRTIQLSENRRLPLRGPGPPSRRTSYLGFLALLVKTANRFPP